jgi:hypothetical protein
LAAIAVPTAEQMVFLIRHELISCETGLQAKPLVADALYSAKGIGFGSPKCPSPQARGAPRIVRLRLGGDYASGTIDPLATPFATLCVNTCIERYLHVRHMYCFQMATTQQTVLYLA